MNEYENMLKGNLQLYMLIFKKGHNHSYKISSEETRRKSKLKPNTQGRKEIMMYAKTNEILNGQTIGKHQYKPKSWFFEQS